MGRFNTEAVAELEEKLLELKSLCEDIEECKRNFPEQISDASFWKHFQASKKIKDLYFAAYGSVGNIDLEYEWLYKIKKSLGKNLNDADYLKSHFWDIGKKIFKPAFEFSPEAVVIGVQKRDGTYNAPYVILTLKEAGDFGSKMKDTYLDIDLVIDKTFKSLQNFCEFKVEHERESKAKRDRAINLWMKVGLSVLLGYSAIKWIWHHWY
jgi:hypothetical protein